jgi:microcin C transport system substrate-binding protein
MRRLLKRCSEGERFFFEKKRQNTFALGVMRRWCHGPLLAEFFLLLFFQKKKVLLLALKTVVDAGLRRHDGVGKAWARWAAFVPFWLWAGAAQAQSGVVSLSGASGLEGPLPYVNADAPKGGSFTVAAVGDFDELNPFILRGQAPESIYRVWQELFKPSDGDSVTAYAELAQSVDVGADGRVVRFHLNPAARFSDGTAVTAADVVWTYRTLVSEGAPIYAALYAGVADAAAPDAQTAVFTLKPSAGRAQILNLAEMYVLPEHFWAGKDFAAPLRTAPVGSGAYKVARVSFGTSITYARVKDWWAAKLPADIGFDNFDTYTQQFFRTDAVALQAFKAGQVDARIENAAAVWARGYDFTPPKDKKLALVEAPLSLPSGMSGFVMNTRRKLFADARVREAIALAFDFGWTNRVLFDGEIKRDTSYFSNSPMAAGGFALPPGDASGDDLPALRQAMALLNAAGWRVRNFVLENLQGEPMRFEILLDDPKDEVIAIPYQAELKALGIDVTIRTLDPASFQQRAQTYDFDMTWESIPATDYPDTEQAGYWGCAAAHSPGGDNWAGVCSPAIDAMIAAEIAAPDVAAKTASVHALDRLLHNGWYFVPWGSAKSEHLAYWADKVAMPAAPLQIGVDYDLWWAK